MANKDYLNYRLNKLKNEVPVLKKKLGVIMESVSALNTELDTFVAKIDTLGTGIESYHMSTQNVMDRQERKLQKQIDKLQRQLSRTGGTTTGSNPVVLEKAKTIAIFDSILSAITSWSQAGDLASDVEAAMQSVLFPSVYERVMSGEDPAYLLSDVPDTARTVVQQGREYVKWIRSICEVSVTDAEAWKELAPEIQKWVVTNALPLIYGEADPDWEDDVPYTLDQVLTWRNNPADRMIAFPKIYDAMDIYSKNRQEIMESTTILSFNQDIAKTRLA